MSSTFEKNGSVVSRIKPLLTKGSIVTDPRSLVSYVVTEYGIVNLKGKSTWERAESLISIAHPDFRDELVREAEKMGIWRRANRIRTESATVVAFRR
jgi:acyl-CoA hydrolase